jgi:hypothetical protein
VCFRKQELQPLRCFKPSLNLAKDWSIVRNGIYCYFSESRSAKSARQVEKIGKATGDVTGWRKAKLDLPDLPDLPICRALLQKSILMKKSKG